MTEADWWACTDPHKMLKFMRDKASDRKMRLFAVACCRRFSDLLSAEEQKAVDVAEAYSDGKATATELADAFKASWTITESVSRDAAGSAARHTSFHDAFDAAEAACCNA